MYVSVCPFDYRISATVTPISVNVCITVDLSSGNKVPPFGGDILRGHQMRDQKGRLVGFWPAKSQISQKH